MKKPKLSRREKQVVRRLLTGKKQSCIAVELQISRRAVESYVARAKAKFKAQTLCQLVVALSENHSLASLKPRKLAA